MADPNSNDRAEELADRFFEDWDNAGDRDRVVDRIAQMRRVGAPDHVIVNVAKSVLGKRNPVSMFMEVTSSEARWKAAAWSGCQIYPAPGIAPPKEEIKEEDRPQSIPTMCKVHGTKLYVGRDEEIPTRCSRCESEGDYSRRGAVESRRPWHRRGR
ncbi:hypothetical protein ABZ635_22585 [Nocardiopsis sp. NPDC007018]|uniref:hypothetical protein n=1 Tax=Nocardiopsis sp. NPDC007018 TaxID=3155721 RepID=UPI0033CFD4D3